MLKTESKQIILSILGIAILIIAFVGISYAAFHTVLSSKENGISTVQFLCSFLIIQTLFQLLMLCQFLMIQVKI